MKCMMLDRQVVTKLHGRPTRFPFRDMLISRSHPATAQRQPKSFINSNVYCKTQWTEEERVDIN